MPEKKEIWMNSSKGKALVLKYDRLGNLTHEIVRTGGKVDVTTDERLINSDRAALETLDIFKNGVMTPVRLLDGTEDAHEIAANPNLKSEEDLRKLFKLQWKRFDEELSTITNTTTLSRLMEIASEIDATMRQVKSIQARLEAVDPSSAFDEGMTIQSFGEPKGAPNVVAAQ